MKKDIEKALKEFLMDVRITGEERKKGIPIISFVYKEENKAVLLKALPLPVADIQTEKRLLTERELLYRVDFFREGEAKLSFGVLPAIREPAPFLTLLENALNSGDKKAGYKSLCGYLKSHNALCSLEALANEELSCSGKIPESTETQEKYFRSNSAYYNEILSYVQTCRDILNSCPAGTPLPTFPDRSAFMAGWYGENGQDSL